jgi:putative ABC transport system permease protein
MFARRFNPGVTLAAISALAIGIGANTAVFSVVNAVLRRPLPYPGADRLVSISRTARGLRGPASIPKFTLWRERNRTLDSLCAYDFAPGST